MHCVKRKTQHYVDIGEKVYYDVTAMENFTLYNCTLDLVLLNNATLYAGNAERKPGVKRPDRPKPICEKIGKFQMDCQQTFICGSQLGCRLKISLYSNIKSKR